MLNEGVDRGRVTDLGGDRGVLFWSSQEVDNVAVPNECGEESETLRWEGMLRRKREDREED